MDFDLDDDQLALQAAATELLAARSSPQRVRAVVEAGGGWDRALWDDLVAQGWPALLAPEAIGGVGLGWVEGAVVLEAVGAHVAPAPILGSLVAVDTLAGLEEPTAAVGSRLNALVGGEAVAAVAHRAVPARRTASTGGPEGWTLGGTTEPVAFAPSADVLLVPAVDDDGDEHLFAVELGGDRPAAESAMDLTREMARVALDGRPAERLGGADEVAAYRRRGAVAYAAEMLGCATRALDMAVEYAGERVQFGRPIGSFQAIKHRCADMLVDVEGMRSATWWAAWCLATGDPEAEVAAASAKAWCSEAAERVLGSALQVHGGIGFTWECDLHLYLKRVQYDRVAFGGAGEHLDRLAELLAGRVRAGEPVIGAARSVS